jgi:hypothetical protein
MESLEAILLRFFVVGLVLPMSLLQKNFVYLIDLSQVESAQSVDQPMELADVSSTGVR